MSSFTHLPMTLNHSSRLYSQVAQTLHLWSQRNRERREMAQWTERDMHDAGVSWCDAITEMDKPFWRA